MTTVREKLKQIRTEKNISQDQLAEMTGISQSFISAFENGYREMQPKLLFKCAEALEVDREALAPVSADVSYSDIIKQLLKLEDMTEVSVKHTPSGKYTLEIGYTFLDNFMDEWQNMQRRRNCHQITQEQYDQWRNIYRSGCY